MNIEFGNCTIHPIPRIFRVKHDIYSEPFTVVLCVAFGQQMAGNHELLSAVIDDGLTSTELWLCGERTTVATQGLARFALTVFVVANAEETDVRGRVNEGALGFTFESVFGAGVAISRFRHKCAELSSFNARE